MIKNCYNKARTYINSLGIILVLLAFSSCENTVDINADWKETIVVYGLLDPNDSVQYIKVNKAFLNQNTSAYTVAQISDSLYLDSTEVSLRQVNTGRVINLIRTNKVKKQPGIFASDVNYLWQTTEKINGNDLYEVTVKNPISKQAVTSHTNTDSPSLIRAPFFNNKSLFSLAPEYITFRATPGANVKAYDVVLEVTYDEFDVVDTTIKLTKTAFWKVMTNYQVDQGDLIRQVEKEAFFQFMANTLTSGPNLKHRFVSFGVTYYSGSQNLIDYMSVNVPAIGIVQKQAEYSNIEGGLGLFASRCVQSIRGIKFEPSSLSFIQVHPLTKKLNFVR
jgi:hypothetical protein